MSNPLVAFPFFTVLLVLAVSVVIVGMMERVIRRIKR